MKYGIYPEKLKEQCANKLAITLPTDVVLGLIESIETARSALDKIQISDRKISGMGSTSGSNETWWLYGPLGNVAREALSRIDELLGEKE